MWAWERHTCCGRSACRIETVYADYRKVNELTRAIVDRELSRISGKIPDERLLECLRSLMQVQDSYLKSVQDEIEKEYGSLDAFLEREMGLDKVGQTVPAGQVSGTESRRMTGILRLSGVHVSGVHDKVIEMFTKRGVHGQCCAFSVICSLFASKMGFMYFSKSGIRFRS